MAGNCCGTAEGGMGKALAILAYRRMQRSPLQIHLGSTKTRQRNDTIESPRSLDLSTNIKREKSPKTRFSSRRPVSSPPSGLDQQHADWCTITTSMQTHTLRYANLPLRAIVRGTRDPGRARQRRHLPAQALHGKTIVQYSIQSDPDRHGILIIIGCIAMPKYPYGMI